MARCRAILAFLLLLAAAPVLAAEEEESVQLPWATANLEIEGQAATIDYSIAPGGPLVALQPLVARLGGQLEIGPLRQAHTLTVQQLTAVFGPGSAAVTIGQEIFPLSWAPVAGPGGLHVPVDLLDRVYGQTLGYGFRWDPARKTLVVSRRPPQDLPVAFDVVHFQGVTTLVLTFPEQPHYRVSRAGRRLEVDLGGDRLQIAEPPRLPPGSLIRRIETGAQKILVDLEADAEASDYVLRQPFRLVFDVHRQRGITPPTPTLPAPADGERGIRTIVIDPGHGGAETGALGPSGAAEKDLTLILARTLKGRLESSLPVRAFLTRDEDVNLSLETRSALANQQKADLFISLHLNSALGAGAHGAETYFLSLQASDERAAAVAAVENRSAAEEAGSTLAPTAGDPLSDLRLILWDLAQSHYLAESQRLANLIQEELNLALGLEDRGVKQAPFLVLKGVAMPAVLVELGFLSNPQEEAKLQNPAYRAQLIDALARAVTRYRAIAERQRSARVETGR